LKIAEITRRKINRKLTGKRLTDLKRMDIDLPEVSLYGKSKRYRKGNINTVSDIKPEMP
jgi:hypothetical protein